MNNSKIVDLIEQQKLTYPLVYRNFQGHIKNKNCTPVLSFINTMINDLEYFKSDEEIKFYLGHFIFRKKSNKEIIVIDGKQRLISLKIIIYITLKEIEKHRVLLDKEQRLLSKILQQLRINEKDIGNISSKVSHIKITQNAQYTNQYEKKSILNAFEQLQNYFHKKPISSFENILKTIFNANYTAYIVANELEECIVRHQTVNRCIPNSLLDQFKRELTFKTMPETNSVFEKFYGNNIKKIRLAYDQICDHISEDQLFLYATQLRKNRLNVGITNDIIRIKEQLPYPMKGRYEMIKSLVVCAESLAKCFNSNIYQEQSFQRMLAIKKLDIAMPFVIKALKFGLSSEEINALTEVLSKIVVRNELIGTKKQLWLRLELVFEEFTIDNPVVQPIIECISHLLNANSTETWYSHWNQKALKKSLTGPFFNGFPKYLLWIYENHLRKNHISQLSIECLDNCISLEISSRLIPVEISASENKINHWEGLGNYYLLSHEQLMRIFCTEPPNYKGLYPIKFMSQYEIDNLSQSGTKWDLDLIIKRESKIIYTLMNLL